MNHAMHAALVALVLAGLSTAPARAERDESGHAPAKRVDVMTKLRSASPERPAYGLEGKDWGVAQTTEVRAEKFHAHTPRHHPLAQTIATRELHALVIGATPPVLIDVLGGKVRSGGFRKRRSLPGALWLKGAGLDDGRADDVDVRLKAKLDELLAGDASRSIVFFCLSAECWLSYNAALRAVGLGYANVYWYRGGVLSWQKAKLATVKVKKTRW